MSFFDPFSDNDFLYPSVRICTGLHGSPPLQKTKKQTLKFFDFVSVT